MLWLRQLVEQVAWQVDLDGNGFIEFAEFVKVMTDVAGCTVQKAVQSKFEELQELFMLFDNDGSGEVTVDEMMLIMRSLGQKPSLSEVMCPVVTLFVAQCCAGRGNLLCE